MFGLGAAWLARLGTDGMTRQAWPVWAWFVRARQARKVMVRLGVAGLDECLKGGEICPRDIRS